MKKWKCWMKKMKKWKMKNEKVERKVKIKDEYDERGFWAKINFFENFQKRFYWPYPSDIGDYDDGRSVWKNEKMKKMKMMNERSKWKINMMNEVLGWK